MQFVWGAACFPRLSGTRKNNANQIYGGHESPNRLPKLVVLTQVSPDRYQRRIKESKANSRLSRKLPAVAWKLHGERHEAEHGQIGRVAVPLQTTGVC